MKNRLLAVLAVLATALLGAATMQAQVDTSDGVARISLIHGDVSTQRGDSGDWAAAALNAPIVSGDKISTGDQSRAEVQLDYANILRLGNRSQATVAGLTRTEIQIQLGQGIANYDVFKDSEANAEIDTPNVSLHPGRRDGSFRIEVRADGDTEIVVRKGEADISTPQGSTHVEKGQMVTVRGTGDATQYKIAEAPSKDDWDRWNSDRDNVIHNAQSWGHTNRYYTGSEDLDAYGRWTTVPDYGAVWVPAVGPEWVPYRAGRWVWEPYWGWTWVSYEPWGWAPYHYGRWFFYGSSWVWWPGPVVGFGYVHPYRPVWSPAYVSFFGFGGGVGVSVGFGFGSFGWLPVGPCDRFYPWWGGYRNHYNVVNVTNIYNIHNVHGGGFAPLHGGTTYSNLRWANNNPHIRGAILTVPAHDFGTGRAMGRPVDEATFRGGRFMTGNLPVVPTRETLSASNRSASPGTIRGGQPQQFFSRRGPVAAPQSFDHQAAQVQQSIRQNSRFTPVNSQMRVNTNADARTPQASGTVRSGFDTKGTMARPSPSETANPNRMEGNKGRNAGPANDGWRRFGSPQAGSGNPAGGQNVSTGRPSVPRPPQTASPQNSRPTSEQSGWRGFSNPGGQQSGNRPANNVPRPPSSMNSGAANRGQQPDSGDAWRRFTPQPRPNSSTNAVPRPGNQPAGNPNSDSWRHLTPQPRPSAPESSARPNNGNFGNYGPRPGNSGGYNAPSRSYSRPPLDMRQPVITPRPSGGYSGGHAPSYGGGSRGAPSGGGGGSHGGGGGQSHPSGGGSGHHR